MSASLVDVRGSCGCCARGNAIVSESLAVRCRVATGWANASEVSDIGLDIADGKGYTLSLFAGFFREIEVVEAYPIMEPGTGEVGTWYRTTTISHTGDNIVASEGLIDADTTIDEDEDPTSPQYVDFLSLDYDESDVSATGKITDVLFRNYLTTVLATLDWEAFGETPVPELGDWQHGIYVSGAWAIGREAQWLPTVVFEDLDYDTQTIDTEIADGAVSMPATTRIYSYTVATASSSLSDTDSTTLPWKSSYAMFAAHDPAPDPSDDSAGWETFGTVSPASWERAEMRSTFGDLWPAFRIV